MMIECVSTTSIAFYFGEDGTRPNNILRCFFLTILTFGTIFGILRYLLHVIYFSLALIHVRRELCWEHGKNPSQIFLPKPAYTDTLEFIQYEFGISAVRY